MTCWILFFFLIKGKPDNPRDIEVMCKFLRARVQWISFFDGGDPQNFTVMILNGLDGRSLSYRFHDEGENKTHVAFVGNLQPSVTYWFYVTAKNSHGSSTSEVTSCKTEEGYIQLFVCFSGEVNYNYINP